MKRIFQKKILSLFLIIAIGCSVSQAQVHWDFKIGVTSSSVTAKSEQDQKAATKAVSGIYFGIAPDVRLSERFSIQPALVFQRKGFISKTIEVIGFSNDFHTHVSYLSLPVDFNYHVSVFKGVLTLGLGPYVAYGLSGRYHSGKLMVIDDIVLDNKGDVEFLNDLRDGEYGTYTYGKPFDYGLHARVGFLFKDHYFLNADFEQGIANLQPRYQGNKLPNSLRNHTLGLALGYRF